ncbi:MAG: hypothetical protein QXO43_04835 [Metallosphaera sp.]
MDLRERFLLNASTLMKEGVHPSIILSGCQRTDQDNVVLFKRELGEVELCLKLGNSPDKSCDFFYPSTKEGLHTRKVKISSDVVAGKEGLLFVDVLYPENNKNILRAQLQNLITIWGIKKYEMETIEGIAGFIWGDIYEERKVSEGMYVGMINRPGGLISTKILYRALNGAMDYFLKRGVDVTELRRMSDETMKRAALTLTLDENVYPVNLTRRGLSYLPTLFKKLGVSVRLEIPSPWYADLLDVVPFTKDFVQSENLFLLIGEKNEVESALSKGERIGFPSFLIGRTGSREDSSIIVKRK